MTEILEEVQRKDGPNIGNELIDGKRERAEIHCHSYREPCNEEWVLIRYICSSADQQVYYHIDIPKVARH